ncbi:MAG: methyltransferase family protein, partial [Bacillota bacterium]
MNEFRDIIVIVSLFFIFGLTHSVLASNWLKQKLIEKLGKKIAFYRLFYNAFALFSFYLIYLVSPKPGLTIYDLDYPLDLIVLLLQFLSLIGLVRTALSIDGLEFFGISQIRRYFNGSYNLDDIDESSELITRGPYRYSRHPLYLYTILFLALRPAMDLFYLVLLTCLIAYFYIGSVFEEKKLIRKFGENYISYMKTGPRIIPFNFRKIKHKS